MLERDPSAPKSSASKPSAPADPGPVRAVPVQQARSPGGAAAPRSFGALRHRGFGAYFALYTVAMMADNV